jgi:hypothetical protein
MFPSLASVCLMTVSSATTRGSTVTTISGSIVSVTGVDWSSNFKYETSSYIIIIIIRANLNKVAAVAQVAINGPAKGKLIIIAFIVIPAANGLDKAV